MHQGRPLALKVLETNETLTFFHALEANNPKNIQKQMRPIKALETPRPLRPPNLNAPKAQKQLLGQPLKLRRPIAVAVQDTPPNRPQGLGFIGFQIIFKQFQKEV